MKSSRWVGGLLVVSLVLALVASPVMANAAQRGRPSGSEEPSIVASLWQITVELWSGLGVIFGSYGPGSSLEAARAASATPADYEDPRETGGGGGTGPGAASTTPPEYNGGPTG